MVRAFRGEFNVKSPALRKTSVPPRHYLPAAPLDAALLRIVNTRLPLRSPFFILITFRPFCSRNQAGSWPDISRFGTLLSSSRFGVASSDPSCSGPRIKFRRYFFASAKLLTRGWVQPSNNPENGRVKTATPPMCNSPLSIGGALYCPSAFCSQLSAES